MFRFMPGGGGTRGNGRGGRRPMLRVLESAISSFTLFPSLLSPSLFSVTLSAAASSCAALTARLLTFNWSCWRFSHQAWVGRRAGDRRRALHWTCHSRERPRWRGGAGRDSRGCHHSHRQKLSSCSHCPSRANHNYLTLSLAAACRLKLQQSMCAWRRLIWLADCWQGAQGGGQLRAERARLPRPRGFALLALQ